MSGCARQAAAAVQADVEVGALRCWGEPPTTCMHSKGAGAAAGSDPRSLG